VKTVRLKINDFEERALLRLAGKYRCPRALSQIIRQAFVTEIVRHGADMGVISALHERADSEANN
jgi:hypothetical protein